MFWTERESLIDCAVFILFNESIRSRCSEKILHNMSENWSRWRRVLGVCEKNIEHMFAWIF